MFSYCHVGEKAKFVYNTMLRKYWDHVQDHVRTMLRTMALPSFDTADPPSLTQRIHQAFLVRGQAATSDEQPEQSHTDCYRHFGSSYVRRGTFNGRRTFLIFIQVQSSQQ